MAGIRVFNKNSSRRSPTCLFETRTLAHNFFIDLLNFTGPNTVDSRRNIVLKLNNIIGCRIIIRVTTHHWESYLTANRIDNRAVQQVKQLNVGLKVNLVDIVLNQWNNLIISSRVEISSDYIHVEHN